MGMSRKVSNGLSRSFIPDYRHAVETVADSDGLGSSGPVESEFIHMQDYSVPVRHSYSLNAEDLDGSAVPFKKISLSKMSLMHKKDLEMRLVDELERVRRLQAKIYSFNTDAMPWPPAADTRIYQDEHTDTFMAEGKRKFTPGKSGVRSKGGAVLARRNEPMKNGLPLSGNFDVLFKQCATLLSRLMGHKFGWIFNKPVDIVEHKIPDYFNIIRHPMDLGTVKNKLRCKQYMNPIDFAADVRLTFTNAMTYNPVGHNVHHMADTLSKIFETRWKSIEKKIPSASDESRSFNMGLTVEPESTYAPAKRQKLLPPDTIFDQEGYKHALSDVEKQRLGSEIDALLDELPENIISFLKESSLNSSHVTDNEIEIDLDRLSDAVLLKLRKLLDDYLLEKQKIHTNVEHLKIERKNEYGHQASKVDDEPDEEEVDIIGNDQPPLSSSPTAKDDKDDSGRGNLSMSRNSICQSASSSSDSQNSSSVQDGVQSSIPATLSDEEANARVHNSETDNVDKNRNNLNGHTEKQSVSDSSVEHNFHQEGENAPPERQVSPEKLYRAALLRGRFADIIIKAQEKNLENADRPDPEKLKLEREELERRRREEKARFQAEAKGAEEARRKAQLEEEAEAKRKRELEREAARHAIQQMEKTVVINESSQFIEDFEMLSSASVAVKLTAELDTKDVENDLLEGFKFKGNSNPLEQLGLYMKNDDDDEEEVQHPTIISYTPNGPEEGEID